MSLGLRTPVRRRRRLRDALRPRGRRPRDRRDDRRARRSHEYAQRRDRAALPATGEQLPPAWALQDPDDWLGGARQRGAGGGPARRASIRRASSGSRTDFTASTPLPVLPRRDAALLGRRVRAPAARVPEAVEAPRRAAPGRARDRGRGSAASRGSRATAGGSRPSGSSRRRCRCSRRIPTSTPRSSAGSRPPTGSSGSSAASRRATSAPRATRASSRTGATRTASTSPRSTRRSRDFVARQARASAVAARRARRRPHRRGRARWTRLPEGIAVAVGNVDAHVTAPAARRSSPGTCSPSWARRPAT